MNSYTLRTTLPVLMAAALWAGSWHRAAGQQGSPEILSPTVQAILETDPQTPEALVRVIRLLIDLNQAKLAKPYLQQLIGLNLDDEALAELSQKFGSGTFVQWMLTPELRPESREFSQKLFAAAERIATDPARLAALVEDVKSPQADVREAATLKLRAAGPAAAAPLINVLADPNEQQSHAYVRSALAALGGNVRGPLLGALETEDDALEAQLIQVFRQMRDDESLPFLLAAAYNDDAPLAKDAARAAARQFLGRLPAQREAAEYLAFKASLYQQRRVPMVSDAEGTVRVWLWDPAQKQSVLEPMPVDDAALTFAARLARDAYQLDQDDVAVRRLYLGTLLEAAAYRNGLDSPLPSGDGTAYAEAAALGVDALYDFLSHAIQHGPVPAATSAAQILGDIGTAELLMRDAPAKSALALAAEAKDRRTRLAAVTSILTLGPQDHYPGSSNVSQTLGFLVTSAGLPRAVVADWQSDEAQRVGGLLIQLGYDVEIATNPRALFKTAVESADTELILVSLPMVRSFATMPRPFALPELRHDNRTAELPIGYIPGPDSMLRS